MKKAIIFDLDGTLWDSSVSVCESWNIVFSRYPEITRRLTPADVQGFMGKTLDQIFPIALPDTPDELRRTEAALRSVVVLRGVSRQPVDTGPAAIPVWCGCPVFSDVPVPCGRSDCVRSVFVCFCAADVSFWYESTRCGCLKRGKSTFEYPAAKYDFLTK